jgi:peptidoglycan/xylan/chitin deacetylase (PgdA/CDA1 family)
VSDTGQQAAPTQARWSRGRRLLSASLGALFYESGLHRLAWRKQALIVLFHRVDDRYPKDPITCSRAQFAAYCDFFARHFKVVSLSELLARMRRGADISRHLVITFDDGYRDNYHVAAAELKKRGLPACFFVPTAFMGTDQVAWWDQQQAIPSEWMTWDEVRSLRSDGFEVGAHTITHADCGCISGEVAQYEIGGSKAVLEAQVGDRINHFAAPYGDLRHMTEENRTLVRNAGFGCCLSTLRGTVKASDSPYNLKRVPIDTWFGSPYDFGFVAIRKWVLANAKTKERAASDRDPQAGTDRRDAVSANADRS